jgi:hypothetical protein
MAKTKKDPLEKLSGTIGSLAAPDKAPGGINGPTYIVFSMAGQANGKTYNGVFYLEAGARNTDCAEQLIDAYVNKRTATVKFRIPGGWDPSKDPSAIVESIEA